ncbi:MAG TPA: hypothetical protein VHO90_09500, partial [Bacteroidales bacterium]|nr:hypothetical protein [Bacteroidales bacterium]
GEEIGMRDVPIPSDELQDPQGKNMPDKNLSRDPARTPMQWENVLNAGFTHGKPWLQLDSRYHRLNVQIQKNDPYSMLTLYRKLIELRQSEKSLLMGSYKPIHSDHQMIAYLRQFEEEPGFLIILNLSHRPCYFSTTRIKLSGKIEIAASPELEGSIVNEKVNLSGDEGIIIRLFP